MHKLDMSAVTDLKPPHMLVTLPHCPAPSRGRMQWTPAAWWKISLIARDIHAMLRSRYRHGTPAMEHLPWHTFRRCVSRYDRNRYVKAFTCADRFRCMAFAQLTYRTSLRDIETCLRAQCGKLYHMGIRGGVSRNTLANANQARDWKIYADFAQYLIHIARDIHADDTLPGLDVHDTVYALDSSTIDLCLSLFPWARFRRTKGAVKLHTLLDLHGNIPAFIHSRVSFPTENSTTSTFWTCCFRKPARSMSWTGPISTSNASSASVSGLNPTLAPIPP